MRTAAALGVLVLLALSGALAHAQTRPSIAALQGQIGTLQSQVAGLQANNVPGLATYVSVNTSIPGRPAVRVTGANLQVVNGMNTTDTTNGVGNLLVGYDEVNDIGDPMCANGDFDTEPNCTQSGVAWSVSHKTGSHNVVIGRKHNYSRWGGLVAGGDGNSVTGLAATVIAGDQNLARGGASSVTGGFGSIASGLYSSVSGGYANVASGEDASVSGGALNSATAVQTSVSGGYYGQATALAASVSGGYLGQATASFASVSGGLQNRATNEYASVSGGWSNSATGYAATVSGGGGVSAPLSFAWCAGTLGCY